MSTQRAELDQMAFRAHLLQSRALGVVASLRLNKQALSLSRVELDCSNHRTSLVMRPLQYYLGPDPTGFAVPGGPS